MSSISEVVIKELSKQILTQGAIIDALCEILIDKNIVSEDEMNKYIDEYLIDQERYIEKLKQENKTTELSLGEIYYGPIGEA